MQKGEVLSELQFYTVDKVNVNGSVVVISDDGQSITLGKSYVDKMLNSASAFASTVSPRVGLVAEPGRGRSA